MLLSLAAMLAASSVLPTHASGGTRVDFELSGYVVPAGGTIVVGVVIDGDDAMPGAQPVPDGLFSYGVRVVLPPTRASVQDDTKITPVAELDYFGFVAGASKLVDATQAAVKGNIEQLLLVPYSGTLLANVEIDDDAMGGCTPYALQLDFFNTQGPGEQIFIDGNGVVLDPGITFGSTTVYPCIPPLPSLGPVGVVLAALVLALGGVMAMRVMQQEARVITSV